MMNELSSKEAPAEGQPPLPTTQIVGIALGVYLAWVVATYLLEGRINLLHRPDPLGRAIYAVVANILIGTVIALLTMQLALKSRLVTLPQLGLRSPDHTLKFVVLAIVLGLGFLLFQGPPSFDPVVLLNGFAQVLPPSIAEVVVCWGVVGTSVETFTSPWGRMRSAVVGALVAIFLFGLYHFAHSAPFNEVWMVFFLMIPAIATSLFYFFGRNLYATAIFHNFLGLYGVLQNIDLTTFSRPMIPFYVMMLVALAALIGADWFLRRQVKEVIPHA
jgi:hypothetical protein